MGAAQSRLGGTLTLPQLPAWIHRSRRTRDSGLPVVQGATALQKAAKPNDFGSFVSATLCSSCAEATESKLGQAPAPWGRRPQHRHGEAKPGQLLRPPLSLVPVPYPAQLPVPISHFLFPGHFSSSTLSSLHLNGADGPAPNVTYRGRRTCLRPLESSPTSQEEIVPE